MTAPASHQPPGRYRFRHLARMEWIKLRSLRSTWLTLALAVAAPAGIALSELIPVRASLEEAFMELTRDSVEYQAAGATR